MSTVSGCPVICNPLTLSSALKPGLGAIVGAMMGANPHEVVMGLGEIVGVAEAVAVIVGEVIWVAVPVTLVGSLTRIPEQPAIRMMVVRMVIKCRVLFMFDPSGNMRKQVYRE